MMSNRAQGFSFIELLAVLAVVGILSTIVWASFSNFRQQQVLSGGTETVLSVLNQARSKTLAAKGSSRHGVRLASTTVTLFAGSSYAAGNVDNQTIALPAGVIIANVAVAGGGTDIVFDRLTGKTGQSGSIRLEIANNSAKSRTITVLSTGIIGTN